MEPRREDHVGPRATMWDDDGPCGSWGLRESAQKSFKIVEIFVQNRSNYVYFRVIPWDRVGTCGTMWDHVGPCGTRGTIRVQPGPCVTVGNGRNGR